MNEPARSELDEATATIVDVPGGPVSDEAPASVTIATKGVELTTTYYRRHEIVQERQSQMDSGLRIMMLLTFGGAIAIQFGKDRPPSHYPALASLVVIGIVAGIQVVRLRRGATTPDAMLVGAVGPLAALACLAGVARLGVLSIAVMPLVMLVYFFGSMDLRARAWTVYAFCSVGYLLLFAIALPGWIPVLSNVHVVDLPATRSAVVPFVFAELILAVTFFLARTSRVITLRAIAAVEAARGEINKREALLDEARLELARALGGGRVGRFTGYDIGPYAVHEVLGRGGMGEVYRAERRDTAEPIALKVLHAHLQENLEHLKRFLQESEVSSSLDSPHIVKVLETGAAGDGSPYIAMELLRGQDLSSILRQHGAIALGEAQTLVAHACSALRVAHEAGIVHRDIKPQNLFRTQTGDWKVLDFGISKATRLAVTMTQHNVIGTPGYMSPEQAAGRSVDPRSDVFSLGAVVYRAVTGKPAFSASSVPAVINQLLIEMPERPSSLVQLLADVDFVLALALAKDRDQRFQNTAELSEAFAEAVTGHLREGLRARARTVLKDIPWRTAKPKERTGWSELPPA